MFISVNWDVGLSSGEGFEEVQADIFVPSGFDHHSCHKQGLTAAVTVSRLRHEFNHVGPTLRQQGTVVSFDFRTHPERGSTHVQVLPCERCAFAPRQTFLLLSDRRDATEIHVWSPSPTRRSLAKNHSG